MIDYSYNKSTLQIGGNAIELDAEIQKVILIDGTVVALLDYTEASNKNILAFDSTGKQLWRIDRSPGSSEKDNPFTGIGVDEGNLIGYTWRGLSVRIDLDTGKWESASLSK